MKEVNMNENEMKRDPVVPPVAPAYDDSALKSSIKSLQKDISRLKSLSKDIDSVKAQVNAVKAELQQAIQTAKAEMQQMIQQQQQQMQQMKNNLGKWHDHLTYGGSYDAGIPKV